MSRSNVLGAFLIWLATAASVWGQWRLVAIVVIGQAIAIAFNVWGDGVGARRFPRFELARVVVNTTVVVAVGHLVGWPPASWLWPPYTALAFDRSKDYVLGAVTFALLTQIVVALDAGVPWSQPLATAILTAFAWRTADLRVRALRTLLQRSDAQRAEIAAAHEALKAEIAARERVEVELRSAQKLEALGRIASGVAHEINTPIQFVGDSVGFLQAGVDDMLSLCHLHTNVRAAVTEADRAVAMAAADDAEAAADLPYLAENLPQALARARDGVDRVALIVRSMKQFAREDAVGRTHVDLNTALAATLAISRHEYALVADVETDLGDLPAVLCNPGEINQVVLSMVVNAAHAIAAVVVGSGTRGTIRVSSARDHDDVVIAIADTGIGIAPDIADFIFDPFFTTKAVGRGTGQGLAISRAIVERHRGRLSFHSAPGRGTTFTLRLPIEAAPEAVIEAAPVDVVARSPASA